MNIKFIKAPAAYNLAYFEGDECEMDEKRAGELIEKGFAVKIEKPAAEKPKKETAKGK
jgi:hypothetical protein